MSRRTGSTPSDGPGEPTTGWDRSALLDVTTQPALAELLRQLRRRDARRRGDSELTYRELAARTGWSHAVIGEYFTGRALPPTDRFDELVRLLGASPAEAGALGTIRDRVEEGRRADRQPAAGGTAPAAGRSVPGQLPADVAGFTGRASQLAGLNRLLDHPAGGVVVVAMSGTAGVGKTALAVHWAHRVRDRFPDGQLYVNLRGFDPGGSVMHPAEALRGFLDVLDVPPKRIPVGLDAQAALYRSLLAGRRMVIVADNARDADHVRPLLPGAPGCLVVVTSRDQLTSLVAGGAHPLILDLLTPPEAQDLLGRRLGADRVAAEPQAAEEIITRCARLPLALAIVAARGASHPQFPLAALAGELRDARARLDALSTGDAVANVRAVFSWSYQTLDADTAAVFRLLSVHPGPDISTPAAASLTGLSLDRARRLLTGLAQTHLVAENTPGRYSLHDLLRVYATEQSRAGHTAEQRHEAAGRLLDHYLHTASRADTLLHPHRDPITLAPARHGVSPESPADPGQALAWFRTEHPVLLAAMDLAVTGRYDVHTWQLAWALAVFLHRQGHWHDWAITQAAGQAAAERLGDRLALAHARRGLGWAYTDLGRYEEAATALAGALDLYRELADHVGQARTHLTLGRVAEGQLRYQAALDHNQLALDFFRGADHHIGQAMALNNIGWYAAQLGHHEQALKSCQQALIIQQQLGDQAGQANTWDSLGFAHHNLSRHDQAIACYQHAADLFRDIADRHSEAEILTRLGDAQLAAGQTAHARATWEQAVAILDQLDNPDTGQLRERIQQIDQHQRRLT
jgi:hypothetical protein